MGNLRTEPDNERTGHPPGIPYIVVNEAAERSSFYGMKAILMVFLMGQLTASGLSNELAARQAETTMHLWAAGMYTMQENVVSR